MGHSCSRARRPATVVGEVERAPEPLPIPTLDGGHQSSDEDSDAEIAEEVGAVLVAGQRLRNRDHGVVRWYVVWRVGGCRSEVRGIHRGTIEAWRDLAREFPAGRYMRGYKLRRFGTEQEAIDAYYLEAVRHNSPIPPNYYVHQ